MRRNFILSPQAETDLHHILDYIASENFVASEKMRVGFAEACAALGAHPYTGQERRDLTAMTVRFWVVYPNYQIIYDPNTSPVQILRIYHSARAIKNILPK